MEITINPSYRDKLYVLNPDTGKFVKFDKWLQEEDPTRAQVVGIQTDFYFIVMSEKYLEGESTFNEAQKAASKFEVDGLPAFRCPRRNERNHIYDAYWTGLKELLAAIGGDKLEEWEWTCEKDSWSSSRYIAYSFWVCFGDYGYFAYNLMYGSIRVIPVVLLSANEVSFES